MNSLSLLLLAVALTAANAAATLRGSSSTELQFQDLDGQNRRRHLMQESTCTLYKKCVTYLPTDEHPDGYHEDTWVCELSEDDSKRVDSQFVDIVESSAVAGTLANAKSGESTLTVTEAFVDTDSPRMYIPDNARFRVDTIDDAPTRVAKNRKLGPELTGTLKALVIRVSDKDGIELDQKTAQLRKNVFEDDASLSTQTEACSYGKLKIEPFTGRTPSNRNVNNGVVNVEMDYSMADGGDISMQKAAMNAAKEYVGDLNDPMFDLVMFCFPPGKSNFIAYAFPNSRYSFYNNDWCGYVSAQMHEVGHNLNLGHSGEGSSPYGDVTGMMGSSPATDDMKRCYNPQKSYQLGWYEDKTETINPLDGSGEYEFVLNGIADYEKNDDALVILRLEQTSLLPDYYVGFNRAEGINKNTWEDIDKVTIVRKDKGGPKEYGQSTKVGSLEPGKSFTIESFNDQRDIEISFVSLEDGDARIVVIDSDPTATPPPSSPPTAKPVAPTKAPTQAPPPTRAPTKAPTNNPPNTPCTNQEKKRFRLGKKGMKRKCKSWANKGRCNVKTFSGPWVWELCKKACNKC